MTSQAQIASPVPRGPAHPALLAFGGALLAGGAAAGIGYLASASPAYVIALAIGAAAPLALRLSAVETVILAVVAGLTFRGAATVGVMPEAGAFLHYPIVYAGLGIALLRDSARIDRAALPLAGIGLLLAIACVSALLNGNELVRPFFSVALLAEPLAVVALLLAGDPPQNELRWLRATLVGLLLIQVPLVLGQLAGIGAITIEGVSLQDRAQGTLLGSDAGAHQIAAIAAVIGIWALFRAPGPRSGLIALTSLFLIAATSGKQALAALPAAVLAAAMVSTSRRIRQIAIAGALLLLLGALPFVLSGYAGEQLGRFASGSTGKNAAIERVADDAASDPATALFGSGPATTVSAAAWLTADEIRYGSAGPVARLGLAPTETTLDLGAGEAMSGSVQTPRSSLIGLFGDLGLIGVFTYFGIWVVLGTLAARSRSPDAPGAVAALVLSVPLAFVGDAFEIPPYPLIVGVIVGMALLPRGQAGAEDPTRA